MTLVPPAPVIPEGVTLTTDLSLANWPLSVPRLRMTYVCERYVCEYGAYLPHPETQYMQHLSNLVLRELTHKVAEVANTPELTVLHRDICIWSA